MTNNGSSHVVDGIPARTGPFDGVSCDDRPPTPVIRPRSLEEARFYAHLGPLRQYLDDDLTTNIHVNANGSIFIEQLGKGKFKADETFTEEKRAAVITYIANLQYGRAMDHLNSRLQADLPVYGSRVQAFAPPIVRGWALILRQPPKQSIDLDDYRRHGQIALGRRRGGKRRRPAQTDAISAIRAAIAQGANIVTVGPTNAGKSVLLNAMLRAKGAVHGSYRVVVVQDRAEVRAEDFEDRLEIMARVDQAHQESNGVLTRYTYEFSDALEDALRSNIDFLVWGEVRDPLSAIGLTKAVNTGHTDGLITTVHANSPQEVFERIEALLEFDGKVPVRKMIAKLFDLFVYIDRDPATGERYISDVQWLEGVNDRGDYVLTPIGGDRERTWLE